MVLQRRLFGSTDEDLPILNVYRTQSKYVHEIIRYLPDSKKAKQSAAAAWSALALTVRCSLTVLSSG